MRILDLNPATARGVLGAHADAILRLARGEAAAAAAPLLAGDVEIGAKAAYGPMGTGVMLFLLGLVEPATASPGDGSGATGPSELGFAFREVDEHASPPSKRWDDALLAAGRLERGTFLDNVWRVAERVGLAIGGHIERFLIAGAAAELAQGPAGGGFFLSLMPLLRSGHLPVGFDDAAGLPLVIRDAYAGPLPRPDPAWTLDDLWPAAVVGMRARDGDLLARLCREQSLLALVEDGSPARLGRIGAPGFEPWMPVPGGGAPPQQREGILVDRDGRPLAAGGVRLFEPYQVRAIVHDASGDPAWTASLVHELELYCGISGLFAAPDESGAVFEAMRPLAVFRPARAPLRLTSDAARQSLLASLRFPPERLGLGPAVTT